MSTVVVARKGNTVAIGCDSLITFGEMRLPAGYEANAKTFEIGGSVIGAVGSTAHFPVLRQALAALPPEELRLGSRDELFDTFLKLHPKLKEKYYLNTKEHDSDPYESSQYTIVIANARGIFCVESYREVFEFERFWAIGSGRDFALGAMFGAYGRAKNAASVARLGIEAGAEFDTGSALPLALHEVALA